MNVPATSIWHLIAVPFLAALTVFAILRSFRDWFIASITLLRLPVLDALTSFIVAPSRTCSHPSGVGTIRRVPTGSISHISIF